MKLGKSIDPFSFDAVDFGYDVAALYINEDNYSGYFEKSPLEERLIETHNYVHVANQSKKPFKAAWMIHESKLLLGFANGKFNGGHFRTGDFVPEYSNEDILFHYVSFSGVLKFYIKDKNAPNCLYDFNIRDTLSLLFEKGVLVKTEKIK